MGLTPEGVGHVPECGLGLVRHTFTALDVLCGGLWRVVAAARVGPDGRARHRTADGGQVVARATSHLVAEDAADHRARYGRRHVFVAALL